MGDVSDGDEEGKTYEEGRVLVVYRGRLGGGRLEGHDDDSNDGDTYL